MQIRSVICFSLLSLILSGNAEEVPDLNSLGRAEYRTRAESSEKVRLWIARQPKKALSVLLKRYLEEDDPEIRGRLLPLMERAYFPPKGYVGIVMRPVASPALNFQPRPQQGEIIHPPGVTIIRVVEGTPAAEAGLQVNDILLKVRDWQADYDLSLNDRVAEKIQENSPGSEIPLTVIREGKTITLTLKLGVLPTPSEMARDSSKDNERELISEKILSQLSEFQGWLGDEIEKHEKNLIAGDRS